ncbi:MAG: MBL fold metallo-hydrolase [Clostridia bacterium]|nr:MBL fold metallo-hydrolase [Clostridia bacterium]
MKRIRMYFLIFVMIFNLVTPLSAICSSDNSNETVILDSLHYGTDANGTLINFDGDEIHTQNGASVTVNRASNNSGNGIVYKYVGEKLTYHGANDAANRDNSAVNFIFNSGLSDLSECGIYAEFTIKTNAPTRTYAWLGCDSKDIYTLCYANSGLESGKDHKIRVEISTIELAENSGYARIYIDDVFKTDSLFNLDKADVMLRLAACKTPVITISNVKIGKLPKVIPGNEVQLDSSVYKRTIAFEDILIDTVHGGGSSSGTKINFDGDEIHSQNGATLRITRPDSNTGNGFVYKYLGDKLSYHGANDEARIGNSEVAFVFDKGTNEFESGFEFLDFLIQTNASTRTYARLEYGGTNIYTLCHADNKLSTNAIHNVRVEISGDDNSEAYIANVYLDGSIVSSVQLSEINKNISLHISSYKTPAVTISSVKYGFAEIAQKYCLSANAFVGATKDDTNACLVVAGYGSSGELIALSPLSAVPVTSSTNFKTELYADNPPVSAKAFLLNKSNLEPLCKNAFVEELTVISDEEENAEMNSLFMLKSATDTICNSFVIKSGDSVIVVDGGFESESEVLYSKIKELGGKVDFWFLSHLHDDHVGAFCEIMEKYGDEISVGNVCFKFPSKDLIAQYESGSNVGYDDKINNIVDKYNINVVTPQQGDVYEYGEVSINVIYVPDFNIHANFLNNTSVIIRIDSANDRVMFLGDMGVEAGQDMLSIVPESELKSNYVQMAHHGQNGVDKPVYEAIAPEYCFWGTPTWLWDNVGSGGFNTGTYKTLIVRQWMSDLGVKKNYVDADGPFEIKLK